MLINYYNCQQLYSFTLHVISYKIDKFYMRFYFLSIDYNSNIENYSYERLIH